MSNPPSPTLSLSPPITPKVDAPQPPPINTMLRPANFGYSTGDNPAAVSLPTTPHPHWLLTSLMDTSCYLTLCRRLPHKLTAGNYVCLMDGGNWVTTQHNWLAGICQWGDCSSQTSQPWLSKLASCKCTHSFYSCHKHVRGYCCADFAHQVGFRNMERG